MRSVVFLILSLFFIINECTIIDSEYEPKYLVPDGYVMWLQDGNDTSIHTYALNRKKLCQIRVSDEWLNYRIIDSDAIVEDDKSWRKLLKAPDRYELEPLLCFWYANGPTFVARDKQLYAFDNNRKRRWILAIHART